MQNSLLQIITEEETDLLDLDIYEKFPYLREEKQKFNEQAQNICYEYANNLFEIDKFFSSDNHQLSLEANLFSQIKQANSSNENKLTKSFEFKEFCKNLTSSNINFDSISQNANDKSTNLQSQTFKDLLNQYANGISEDKNAQYSIQNPQILNQQDSPENELFYGLDDRIIDLKEIKLEGDGRITYKNKQDLKTVTFLISGYLTQDFSASENFQLLVKLIDSSLQEHFNQIVIKSIYWLIELLGKCLKLAGTSLFQNQIQQFKTALDSIIEDFQASYEQAKIGGAILAESINNQNLMGSLNIDFMGHSLGTVVTAYALKNLSISARYLMLFGGAATIEEIEGSQQMFQKCYNFYSDNDSVIKTFLIKAKLIVQINSRNQIQ
ncbi:hypothetical protein TTHERM_00783190 (macronuclear) [Tetrahymena thermophila SB210]|uniref:Uncharacterized protein n=1 Tax=Tetrahymena thermophila (strain SB210) TaxID=312017 RepID=Q231S1_TETTS|nr:hypothetical protein TTHERM_00783190 [Tetrahymena thermophila SB210]EAR91231.2 hypothetical protein TTHERM_00783190 [Tetrahymena thermophila SB210]|eukprot:XP_001011476.2 hypothetical protein TTHERM_00783190 [Tetrahymena thermophila SB210]